MAKLNTDGSSLVYSTYLGGGDDDTVNGIAIDDAGAAYVTGDTGSSDFPTTVGAYDGSFNSSPGQWDAFVTKVNPDGGSLTYSTFLGGSTGQSGYKIAVDSAGAACVAGVTTSSDFPTTAGALDSTHNGGEDVFVTQVKSDGSGLDYSTYLGGVGYDIAHAVAMDGTGRIYVTGRTGSDDFPTTVGTFDRTRDDLDAFVAALESDGSALVYSTFLGGSGTDEGRAIAVDGTGTVYVAGGTDSVDFPTSAGAYDETYDGSFDAFVTKLVSDGSGLAYSTFLGGSDVESGWGITVDASGTAYLTGLTYSSDFPTTAGAFDESFGGERDAFVVRLRTVPVYVIAGRVTDGSYNAIADVHIASSAGVTGTTDSNGDYALGELLAGAYTITPTKSGYAFSPAARVVTVPPDASGQGFTMLPLPVSTVVPSDTATVLVLIDTQGLTTTLAFSAGAVTQTTNLILTPTLTDGGAGLAFAGHAFEAEAWRDGNSLPDFAFEVPVTVTIHYSVQDVRVVSDEDRLALMRRAVNGWEDAANTCIPPSTYGRDLQQNVIDVAICHLSPFVLLGPTHQIYLPLVLRTG